MDHRSKGAKLLARLRRETNGAIVADMEGRGVHYVRSYGVSQYVVRAAAENFAPDHEFAKYLWGQSVRELKLAAPTIADSELVTGDELKFWFNGAVNNELAENLASFLLSKTQLTTNIIELYGCSPNPTEQYIALLSAARSNLNDLTSKKIIECAVNAAEKENPMVLRAAGLLLSKAANNHTEVLQYINSLVAKNDKLLNEIMI